MAKARWELSSRGKKHPLIGEKGRDPLSWHPLGNLSSLGGTIQGRGGGNIPTKAESLRRDGRAKKEKARTGHGLSTRLSGQHKKKGKDRVRIVFATAPAARKKSSGKGKKREVTSDSKQRCHWTKGEFNGESLSPNRKPSVVPPQKKKL